jgi:hypothetical protein
LAGWVDNSLCDWGEESDDGNEKVLEVCMLTASVSGSFHRHMEAITTAVHELAALSVRVLSPADPRIVAQQGEFLFVASDSVRSVRLVQDRHLESIRAADFLWLVCPDGYVGSSASQEIGYAIAFRVPIYATQAPSDLTLQQYVKVVPSLSAAVSMITAGRVQRRPEGILIDPHATVEHAHYILEQVGNSLTHRNGLTEPARTVHRNLADLQAKLSLPTHFQ